MAKNPMHEFVWQARDKHQQVHRGSIMAPSLVLAKAQLFQQGLLPIKIAKKSRFSLNQPKPVKTRQVIDFTRQIATMLKAGVSLVQSFNILLVSTQHSGLKQLVNELKISVEQGSSLTDALKKHPKQFDELYCNLIYAGELSGTLDEMLERLAIQLEKADSIKKKVKKAMHYPIAVISVAVLVMAIMLIFVIPQFQSMFQGFGANLPAYTLAVVNFSNFVRDYWWVIAIIVGLAIYSIVWLRRHSLKFKTALDRLSLRLPIIGGILIKSMTARFSRTLATTFAAGIPLVEALGSVAGATGNEVYRQAILRVQKQLEAGYSLQQAMRDSQVFLPMVVQMVAVGEESGTLDAMLIKAALIYEEEVDLAVSALSDMLEPAIMLVLGVMVAALVIAMYLPIFKLASVV